MAIELDLRKSKEKLTLDLRKALLPKDAPVDAPLPELPLVQVGYDIDVSGSYDDEHRAGLTDDITRRIMPWAMALDQDGQGDVFTFSDGEASAHHVGLIDASTCDGYIRRNIIKKVPGYNGCTDYAHVLRLNLEHFGWIEPAHPVAASTPKKHWWNASKPAEAHASPVALAKQRSLILFDTDGANSDQRQTTALLKEMEEKKYLVYIMFIAYSQGQKKKRGESDADFAKRVFPYLWEVSERFSNTGLVVIDDIPAWTAQSDDQLNKLFITEELVNWLKV